MFTPEYFILISSSLIILGLILSKASFRIGLPTLLLFLGMGMLAGKDGLGISFNDPRYAQFIGVVALTVILFSGGMDTDFKEIRPRLKEGLSLATFGVLLTTLLTGSFIYLIFQVLPCGFKLGYLQSLLCAAVMSSTDSASVFSILRSKDVTLKQNLRPVLELESGSNDPMAYMLTIILIQFIQFGELSFWQGASLLLLQFAVGSLVGIALGYTTVWVVNKINIPTPSLYPILVLGFAGLIYSVSAHLQGNGYLAVYIAGLIVGNKRLHYKKNIMGFFDGFTWLWQLVIFLSLGLLVTPSHLVDIALPAILIGLFLIFFGRPIATHLTLLPLASDLRMRARHYIAWIGLRGAAPIIFATYPLMTHVPNAVEIFNVVFFITLLSLVIQGSSAIYVAEKLQLVGEPEVKRVFDVDLPDEIKTSLSEIVVTKEILQTGLTLAEIPLPQKTLAIMVLRDEHYFVPSGDTQLKEDDHILLLSDDQKALLNFYKENSINPYRMERNK